MNLKIVLLILLVTASAAAPMATTAMPPANTWEIGPFVRGRNYSIGMPSAPDAAPGGGLTFEFPQSGRGEIDALTTAIGPLSGARTITLRYRIDAARGTRFVAAENPDQAATISLYFQQRGDNWTARGPYESYRWYSPDYAVIPLAPGVRSVTVRLDDGWTNINGRSIAERPEGFAAALDDTARIGLAFGTSAYRSHGVCATAPARFTLLGLEVE
jgi:hypothetical protein